MSVLIIPCVPPARPLPGCACVRRSEFFVIDREMFMRRPVLMNCGRTLIGKAPARGQNTDLNYFGTIPPRVHAFFQDFQERAWKLGISAMVAHNEVAPAQHEMAPIYLVANAAADQNILTMDGALLTTLESASFRACFRVILLSSRSHHNVIPITQC